MNYRNKIEKLGFEITTSYSRNRHSVTTWYNVSKDGKTLSYTSLKEAYNLLDLFFIM